MSTAVVHLTVRLADEPDRRVRLDVPVDAPLAELLGDFVDAAEEHAYHHRLEFDADADWRLQLPDGSRPNGECLAELGVSELALYDALRAEPPFGREDSSAPPRVADHAADAHRGPSGGPVNAPVDDEAGTRFLRRRREPPRQPYDEPPGDGTGSSDRPDEQVRHNRDEQSSTRSASGASPPTKRSAPWEPAARRSRARGSSTQRVVRARAEAALPRRMSAPSRLLQALSALSPFYDLHEAEAFGLEDPARFMREHRSSAIRRVREAWWSTDYERLLEAMILMPCPPSCQTVAVLSPKGGVGKTTITGLVGMLLSFVRRTVTVAVDANPDMSNLSAVLSPGRGKLIDELLKGALADGRSATPMEVLGELGNGPHGLRVAPSPNDPTRALDKQSYLLLYKRLKAVAEVLVLDCGTGLFDDPAQAAVETADQLVVVVDGAPDTMAMVASAECQRLLRAFPGPSFLVVNKLTRRVRRQVNLAEFEQELSFARGIVEVAYDERAAARLSRFSWDDRPPADWAIRIRELAALLAASWPA